MTAVKGEPFASLNYDKLDLTLEQQVAKKVNWWSVKDKAGRTFSNTTVALATAMAENYNKPQPKHRGHK